MKKLRVLHIEDSERDVAIIARTLASAEYKTVSKRVENADELRDALSENIWDVILCDYSMPKFDALDALAVLHSMEIDIPFIVISGTIGEDTAVKAMVAGAHDYLMKDNLMRLVPAIERELQDAKNRRIAREAEEALTGMRNDLEAAVKGYERVLDNSLDIICTIDEEGRFAAVNKASVEIWGYEPDELIGKLYMDLVHPDDHAMTVQIATDVLAGRPVTTFENRYVHKDGKVVAMMWSANWSEADKTMFCIARDVTGRKLAEEGLIRSEERYRDLVENAHDIIFTSDLSGTFTSVNKACEQITGYSIEENQGLKFQEIVAPEHIDKVKEMIVKKLEGELVTAYEAEIVAKDGHRVAIEVNSRLILKDGIPIGIQGIARDVTSRKNADKALRLAEERYRSIFENAVDGLFQSTPDGRFTVVNPALATMLGFDSPEELLSQRTDIAAEHYVDGDCRSSLMKTLAEDGFVTGFQCQVYRRDLSKIWTVENIRAIRDESGTILHYEGSIGDITEHKSLEEQLRQSQKLESVGRLAGGIAHDFNNMLTAINGYSDLTLRRMNADDPLRSNIEEIKKAGDRSAALTNQLLAFSRQQILRPEVFYLNRIINETSTLLERMIGEDIELVTRLHPKTGKVKADPGQLSQILMNLAVNARDAMPNGGKLTFETSNIFLDEEYTHQHISVLPGAYVWLTISDNGTGMDAETQEHIFEPFFTTKPTGLGTGLGLATVYGIVKQSNGHIMVYSEPGIGTTFSIYLPRVTEPFADAETVNLSHELPKGTETILLVEDEEMVRNLARKILETCGYTVLEAGNGRDALGICEIHHESINLVMTDVVMPEMGGRELAEKVSLNWPRILVLFTSGYTDDAIVRHGAINASSNFIQKPFRPEALARKVRDLLDTNQEGYLMQDQSTPIPEGLIDE